MMSTRTSYDKSEIFVLYGLLIGHQLVAFSVESSSGTRKGLSRCSLAQKHEIISLPFQSISNSELTVELVDRCRF
jgi:hypothetical protein